MENRAELPLFAIRAVVELRWGDPQTQPVARYEFTLSLKGSMSAPPARKERPPATHDDSAPEDLVDVIEEPEPNSNHQDHPSNEPE